eukprot:TRINITY_DN1917_c0_g1_i1.p1 TRINITY_DN1917_c0_g1~~TRINITY_DN1917_c0_g1_i1.p1  ORF type:complete len:180 (-),score=19.21 TRINITY_DN1917_c0_g1_i1:27-566(-)
MCPKSIIGCGDLVKMLLHTGVTRYLDFKHVGGSFVFQGDKLHEVPVTAKAAMMSGLMGLSQRIRAPMFFKWVAQFDERNKDTWSGLDIPNMTMSDVYKYWKIDDKTQSLTGHAIALYLSDEYTTNKAETIPCLKRIQLYATSLARYESSPYIYHVTASAHYLRDLPGSRPCTVGSWPLV